MIIKHKDDSQDDIDYLSDLLDRDIADNKKNLIDRELKNLYTGLKGETTPADYLDGEFKDTRNWTLIHDLRIEHNGVVAQIDHLLIGREIDIYVIESKSFSSGVSISNEGGFSYIYNDKAYSFASPIIQNEQYIKVLQQFLQDTDLLPMRLGIKLTPRYRNIVLISPDSELSKPKKGLFDCSAVMKADKFMERFRDDKNRDDTLGDMASIAKVVSQETLQKFSEKIVLHHKPISINYREKFELNEAGEKSETDQNKGALAGIPDCPVCSKPMILREAKQGKNEGKQFWGCQQFPKCRGVLEFSAPAPETIKSEETEPQQQLELISDSEAEPLCPKCNGPMVKRVSKKGKNAGKEFWGCNDFPNCRGVVSIE